MSSRPFNGRNLIMDEPGWNAEFDGTEHGMEQVCAHMRNIMHRLRRSRDAVHTSEADYQDAISACEAKLAWNSLTSARDSLYEALGDYKEFAGEDGLWTRPTCVYQGPCNG